MNTIVMSRAVRDRIGELLHSAPLESAGVLFCNAALLLHDAVKLIGVDFEEYLESDYAERTPLGVTIRPEAVNRHLQRARSQRKSIVQVHTHPGSDYPDFSARDDAGEKELVPVIFGRVPNLPHGSIVCGQKAWAGRLYTDPDASGSCRILVVGRNITRMDDVGLVQIERFNRSELALGRKGQAALTELRVGVVGLGGTGSIVAQHLAYLGVRDVIGVDPDTVEASNLNRLVGATGSDIGSLKVEVAKRQYESSRPDGTFRAIAGDVVDESTAREVLDRDVIICCTDSQASRGVLNWLAYQYLIPTFDMGIQITVDSPGRIADITGRVQLLGPELPCLHCCEVLDFNRLREELMSPEERAKDSYVVGERVQQPAVITLNAVVSSLATTMLLAASTGLPMEARMQTYRALKGEVRPVSAQARSDCPVCESRGIVFGSADSLIPVWRRASTQ